MVSTEKVRAALGDIGEVLMHCLVLHGGMLLLLDEIEREEVGKKAEQMMTLIKEMREDMERGPELASALEREVMQMQTSEGS